MTALKINQNKLIIKEILMSSKLLILNIHLIFVRFVTNVREMQLLYHVVIILLVLNVLRNVNAVLFVEFPLKI